MDELRQYTDAEKRDNLLTLARFLWAEAKRPVKVMDFRMSYFGFTKDGQRVYSPADINECGTAGCAIGHGPAAGFAPCRGEEWDDYSSRCFLSLGVSDEWDWMFNAPWFDIDNTRDGAALRIAWYLMGREIPDGWGDTDYLLGEYTFNPAESYRDPAFVAKATKLLESEANDA